MKQLIDKDVARRIISSDRSKEQMLAVLDSVPSALTRCKDCKHYAGEGMYCAYNIVVQFDHFYCYYAERREDADLQTGCD